MYTIDQDDFLAHHGVLGMKWGVRKQRESSGPKKESLLRKDIQRARHPVSSIKNARTNRRNTLEARYKKKGFSSEVAQKKARNRTNVETAFLTSFAIERGRMYAGRFIARSAAKKAGINPNKVAMNTGAFIVLDYLQIYGARKLYGAYKNHKEKKG